MLVGPVNNGHTLHRDPVLREDLISSGVSNKLRPMVRPVQLDVQTRFWMEYVQLKASRVVDVEFNRAQIGFLQDHLQGQSAQIENSG